MIQTSGGSGRARAARLFVALEVPREIKIRLLALKSSFPGLKWTPAANLHLTLRFIGSVPPTRIAPVQQSLRLVRCAAFNLTLAGLGLFSRGSGGVLWAGVREEPALRKLKDLVDLALRSGVGLNAEEASFSPHLTLSRFKNLDVSEKQIQEKSGEGFGEFTVAAFTLFRSFLRPAGAVHEPVERYPLDWGRAD
ncbi:MAG: RNA 2',3'-cyclic phosphodiesterase [Desulfovibrio sp.]|jgi:2'-5' RNA ligase|nr:RNA 2',3'-cyclic phosphodiesterase [Desulfovibrio sp.]